MQTVQVVMTVDLEKSLDVKAELGGRGPKAQRGSIATFKLLLDDDNFMMSNIELFIENADYLMVRETSWHIYVRILIESIGTIKVFCRIMRFETASL